MALRIALLALVSSLLLVTAVAFEGASSTALALDLVSAARNSATPAVRTAVLRRAEVILKQSWSQPLRWHAGAAEALSIVNFSEAEAQNDAAHYDQSAEWAGMAVRLAPIQPHAWTRLAELAELNHPNPVCDLDGCLARAWSTAPVIDSDTACTRLQIAYRHNLLTTDDPRIDLYLQSGVTRSDAASCLAFLPPTELFGVLLRNTHQTD